MLVVGKSINESIDALTKVLGNVSTINLFAKDDRLSISTSKDGSGLGKISIPCKGDISVSLGLDTLKAATAGRGEMEFSLSGGSLNISSGRYKGTIPTFPYNSLKFDKSKGQDIDEALSNILISGYENINIKSIFESKELEFVVHGFKDSGVIFVADNYHTAVIETTRKLPNIILPQSYFNSISKLFKGKAFSVSFSENNILFSSEDIKIQLPTIETSQIPAENILGLLKKKPTVEVLVDSTELKTILNNIYAVREEGKPLELKLDKGRLTLECSSSLGKMSDSIKVNTKESVSANVEFLHFLDLLSKIKSETRLNFYGDKGQILALKCSQSIGEATYFCACLE